MNHVTMTVHGDVWRAAAIRLQPWSTGTALGNSSSTPAMKYKKKSKNTEDAKGSKGNPIPCLHRVAGPNLGFSKVMGVPQVIVQVIGYYQWEIQWFWGTSE